MITVVGNIQVNRSPRWQLIDKNKMSTFTLIIILFGVNDALFSVFWNKDTYIILSNLPSFYCICVIVSISVYTHYTK